MKVKKFKGIVCPACDEVICDPDTQELYQCGECDEKYLDEDAAKKCCKE